MKKEAEFRASTLNERSEFYEKEFSLEKVKKWFRKNKMSLPQLCAVDAGSETGIIIDKSNKDRMLYFRFSELSNRVKKIIPEDVYYDRNHYKNPDKVLNSLKFNNHISQELVFDIDLDNMNRKISKENLDKAFIVTIKMKKELEKQFDKIEIVYSGRGFHLHVHDKKASYLTIKEREEINKNFSKYPIDPWVSRGYIRLIRMPFTLNSLVSRVVTPIDKSFNYRKTLPKFISN